MIIRYFNFIGCSITPAETNTPLVINTDAVRPAAVVLKRFEAIPWRHTQIAEVNCRVKHEEFAKRGVLNLAGQLPRHLAPEEFFRLVIPKALDHISQ